MGLRASTDCIDKPGVGQEAATRAVFDQIGDFLVRNRLSPDPVNYSFAFRVFTDPQGALALAVAAMTDGGVRLTARDIESLGGQVGANIVALAPPPAAEGLVARTQMQVEGFHDLVRAMRSETSNFGRDLAAQADAIRDVAGANAIDEVGRITRTMLERVRVAETQLESATKEANELREKLEEARDNARRDPLTGLPNRRAFEEGYAEAAAKKLAVCVAVCDIDRFKLVNDGFGHAVGDRVLKAIATVLTDECAGHLVARYGGEEFVVLFSGTDLANAQRQLETARQIVSRKRYRLRETDAPLGEVTFSAGLTAARPSEAVDDVFVRADQLLYAAKADGRNCLKTG